MKLDTFTANALQDIETGLRTAEQATGKDFWITSAGGNAGVSFDIAVTAKMRPVSRPEGLRRGL